MTGQSKTQGAIVEIVDTSGTGGKGQLVPRAVFVNGTHVGATKGVEVNAGGRNEMTTVVLTLVPRQVVIRGDGSPLADERAEAADAIRLAAVATMRGLADLVERKARQIEEATVVLQSTPEVLRVVATAIRGAAEEFGKKPAETEEQR